MGEAYLQADDTTSTEKAERDALMKAIADALAQQNPDRALDAFARWLSVNELVADGALLARMAREESVRGVRVQDTSTRDYDGLVEWGDPRDLLERRDEIEALLVAIKATGHVDASHHLKTLERAAPKARLQRLIALQDDEADLEGNEWRSAQREVVEGVNALGEKLLYQTEAALAYAHSLLEDLWQEAGFEGDTAAVHEAQRVLSDARYTKTAVADREMNEGSLSMLALGPNPATQH